MKGLPAQVSIPIALLVQTLGVAIILNDPRFYL